VVGDELLQGFQVRPVLDLVVGADEAAPVLATRRPDDRLDRLAGQVPARIITSAL